MSGLVGAPYGRLPEQAAGNVVNGLDINRLHIDIVFDRNMKLYALTEPIVDGRSLGSDVDSRN